MKKLYCSIELYKIICAILSVLCMIVIFCFSSENGGDSSDTSGSFTEFAVEHFIPGFEDCSPARQADIMAATDHIIRKTAHFSIYTALGFLVSCTIGKRRLISKGSAAAVIICFIYACSDEIHQYFVPERSCRFTDVMIDTSGAITGILISVIALQLISKKILRK